MQYKCYDQLKTECYFDYRSRYTEYHRIGGTSRKDLHEKIRQDCRVTFIRTELHFRDYRVWKSGILEYG